MAAKSPDAARAAYARKQAKKAATPARIKVSQGTIDRIKKMGMTASLKKAGTSKNAEFLEGIKRMYGARRLSAAQGQAADRRIPKPSIKKTAASAPKSATAPKKKPLMTPSGKPYVPSDWWKARQAQAARQRAKKKSTPTSTTRPVAPGGRNR